MLSIQQITTNNSTTDFETLVVLLTATACILGGFIIYTCCVLPRANQEDIPLNDPVIANSEVSSESETDVSDDSSSDYSEDFILPNSDNFFHYADWPGISLILGAPMTNAISINQIYDMLWNNMEPFGGWQISLLFILHRYVYRFFGYFPGFMDFIDIFFDELEWIFDYYNNIFLGRLAYLAYNVLHLVHYYTFFMGETPTLFRIDQLSYYLFNMFYNSMVDGYPGLQLWEVWANFRYIVALAQNEATYRSFVRRSFFDAVRYWSRYG